MIAIIDKEKAPKHERNERLMRVNNQTPDRISEALAIYSEIANRMSETFHLVDMANALTEDFCLDLGESGSRVIRNCDDIKKMACENEQIVSEIKTELERLLEELTLVTPPQIDFQ